MNIKRTVPNIETGNLQQSIEFYREFLGLKVAMDMDWIITFVSESNPTAQVSVIRQKQPDRPFPDISIEVEDVDEMYARAKEQNVEIAYSIRDEPWGVRRFFVKDPNGKVINILSHL